MAKGQTRLIAEVDSSPRVLLSVAENSSGEIHITPARAEVAFYEDREPIPTSHQVYTVHHSNKWTGNTIHHKILTPGAGSRESYLNTLAVAQGRLQPLYAHTFKDLRDAAIPGSVRKKDTVLSIGNYEPKGFTLHLVLFLGPPNSNIDALGQSLFYCRYIMKFRDYSLLAAVAYTALPSIPEGNIRHYSSAYPTIDGVRNGELLPAAPGLGPVEAREAAQGIITGCHGASFVRTIEFFRRQGDGPDGEWLQMMNELFKLGPLPFQPPFEV
jgi:hypothetical protein